MPTRRDRALAPWPWAVMGVGVVLSQAVRLFDWGNSATILVALLAIFFPVLVLRLLLSAAERPERRLDLLVLVGAITAWALGSISVNAAPVAARDEFPAPGEWLFVVSYLGMAGYLLRDVDRRLLRPSRAWLDVVIVCGGTACLASLLLVTPIRIASGEDGISLLLALIYPLADIALALLVLSQALLQVRSDRRKTEMMGLSFVLLAAADSEFALRSSSATYEFDLVSYVLWGVGFSLLVAAACRPEQPVMRAVPRAAGTPILVGAGLLALAVLVIRPDALAYYVVPPATLTLGAVAARLALALRDANRANDAFALSQTDDLTKLPNRRAVRAWLTDGLAESEPMALMLLDLDGFKDINDSLGHRAGDIVLRLVGVRMLEAVDSHDHRVARLGGDEFAVILGNTDEIELVEIAQKVRSELAKPIVVEDIELTPAASIGITVAGPDDPDGSDMLRRADVAMYQAKRSGLGIALYDAQLDEFSRSRLQLAEELRKGIAEGQIELWYQPQLDTATMRVAGLEALVRWRHPTQGVISPVSFLTAARRAGLMAQLSQVVAEQAVRDYDLRRRAGIDVPVAINCAPPELLGPTFLPHLYEYIETWQVPAERLVLEVTEDSFLADPHHTRDVLLDLRDHGVQVSIDDYGTGFSSLVYLRNLPVQELKIDRALIGDVAVDERSRAIVESTVRLAHALRLRIVAEGVENAEDLAALAQMGVDVVQGFHLARPMPADLIDAWVRDCDAAASAPTIRPTDLDLQEPR